MRRTVCAAVALAVAVAAAWAPLLAASETSLRERDRLYDPKAQMLLYPEGGGQWIHTHIQKAPVHPTRASIRYAADLFDAGGAARLERARKVLAKVLRLQDTNPRSRTYGIWSYFLEEPLDEMNNPDWNWADFIGLELTRILAGHADDLPADLAARARAGLGHACESILRRNVGLGYTNIAMLDCAVTATAGHLLDEPKYLDYGRDKLQRMIAFVAHHGSFTEYNSPTYTMVTVDACEHVLAHVEDKAAREAAESLRRTAWRLITDHYHPGTEQWAGPHARCYRDHLAPGTAETWIRLGKESAHRGCPPDMAPRLRRLPRDPLTVRNRFYDGGEKRRSVHGTTHYTAAACLGSASYEDLWYQRRVVLGYWTMPAGRPAVVRLRFLKDGRDFASAVAHTVQEGFRVLAAVAFVTGRGEYHPSIGRPQDGVFRGSDFRLRWEVTAREAEAAPLPGGRFELAAGGHKAVVHTVPGRFGEREVAWTCGTKDGRAFVDAVCYEGKERAWRFDDFGPVLLASGIELVAADGAPSDAPVEVRGEGGKATRIEWADLALPVPPTGRPYRR
ncbi:MAG: hypothetical protein R6X20_02500 [Phycisphaerae bacterium]